MVRMRPSRKLTIELHGLLGVDVIIMVTMHNYEGWHQQGLKEQLGPTSLLQ